MPPIASAYHDEQSSSTQLWYTERVLRIAEDDFRRRIIAFHPAINADVQLLAKMIRELVDLEREKRGLDRPQGVIELERNSGKTKARDPDFIGRAHIAGRHYRAAAWAWGKEKIRVAVSRRA